MLSATVCLPAWPSLFANMREEQHQLGALGAEGAPLHAVNQSKWDDKEDHRQHGVDLSAGIDVLVHGRRAE